MIPNQYADFSAQQQKKSVTGTVPLQVCQPGRRHVVGWPTRSHAAAALLSVTQLAQYRRYCDDRSPKIYNTSCAGICMAVP